MKAQVKYIALGGVALVALLLVLKKKDGTSWAADLGAGVGNAVVSGAQGVVLGIGDSFGLPRTSETECEKARREGRTWDASFVCPAGTWLDYLVTPAAPSAFAGARADAVSSYQNPYANYYDNPLVNPAGMDFGLVSG